MNKASTRLIPAKKKITEIRIENKYIFMINFSFKKAKYLDF